MTFYDWLMKQNTLKDGRYKDTRFGDLATDMAADESFPQGGELKQIREHLENCHASWEAMETFRCAWTNYRAWLRANQDKKEENT